MASLKQFIANAKAMLPAVTGKPGWLDAPSMHLEQVTGQIKALLGKADQFAAPDIDLHQADAALKAVLGEAASTAPPAISLHDTAAALKAVTGKASATAAPDITLAAAKAHVDAANNPHATTAAQVGAMAITHPANAISGFGNFVYGLGPAQSAGSASTVARSDHVHPFPNAVQIGAIPDTHFASVLEGFGVSASPLAAAASPGVSYKIAREDHVHPFPTAAQVGAMATTHPANAITGFGSSAQALAATQSAGAATTVARSDHRHPYPTAAQVGAAATYGDAANQFNADFFQATQDVGYRFANSPGSYAMTSTDGGVRVPVGGGFHVRNTSLAYAPCYASAFTVSSNRRLKRVLGEVRHALERVRALQPIRYRLEADGPQGRIELGLIAEDAREVLPEVVYPVTDGANGPDGASLSIDYGRLAVLALAAIRELEARVEALEAAR